MPLFAVHLIRSVQHNGVSSVFGYPCWYPSYGVPGAERLKRFAQRLSNGCMTELEFKLVTLQLIVNTVLLWTIYQTVESR